MIDGYLYIDVNMRGLSYFDPRPAVFRWPSDKDRCQHNTHKVSQQAWFKSVFDVDGECEEDTQDS